LKVEQLKKTCSVIPLYPLGCESYRPLEKGEKVVRTLGKGRKSFENTENGGEKFMITLAKGIHGFS
jgi:hypothetical protein